MNIEKTKNALVEFLQTGKIIQWFLLLAVTGFFAIVLTPSLLITQKYNYELGDVAQRDIKASRDFLIEDNQATQRKQQESGELVLTVYDHDIQLASKISTNIEKAFNMLRDTAQAGTVLPEENDAEKELDASAVKQEEKSLHDLIWEKKDIFEKELGISVSKGAFTVLEKELFSREISSFIIKIIRELLENGVVANKEILLRESDRGIILRAVGTNKENIVNNLKQFYGLDQAKSMVRIMGYPLFKNLNYTLFNLIIDFSQRLIQPNITLNRNETEERKKKAQAAVKPVFYKIKAGEMLLREGERVTAVQLLKLKELRKHNKEEKQYIRSMGTISMILLLMIISYFLHIKQRGHRIFKNNKDLLFISLLLILFFFIPGAVEVLLRALSKSFPFFISDSSIFLGIPLAAGAMTVCLFMGFEVAITFSVILSACTAFIFINRFEIFIYFLLNSVMAAYWMQSCRERKILIQAGFKIGLLNMFLSTAVAVHTGDFSGLSLIANWGVGFMGGIGAGIITAGIVPLIELTFNYTTDISLLELANLERPILRKLMMEAPGTYHHCVIVGSMVEAAAAEIGANPLLAKVCGYYHDIGKVKKPLYFIENQSDGKNRHDKLAPSMSGLILISHVKDGVELAKKHKLVPEIIDAIRQHHGTSIIRFFYEKAKQLKGEDSVKIDDYRYPGPRPQNREIGLVMLADVVEAASRSLENPTPSRIQGLVQNLINKIFSDGQLDNCELTLNDLHKIAKCFNKILNGIHHHRIEYPEQSAGKNGKEKNGNTDNKPQKPKKDSPGENRESSQSSLKRLGVS
ncbi:HDIG domain-containing protein [Desulfobacterales bacterium HSG17]|nr:HDIG domain-containing protein [Desulfobacterales bacterium HSG17]